MPGRPTRPEKRRAFHESRINAEKNGVRKAWWASWWLAAELKLRSSAVTEDGRHPAHAGQMNRYYFYDSRWTVEKLVQSGRMSLGRS